MALPQKIKSQTALWPSNSTSENLSEESQNTSSKEYMHPYVHCSVTYNSHDLEAAEVDKKAMVHLYNRILPGHQKEGHLTLCNTIVGHYAKWNKSEKCKYHIISLLGGI